MCHKTIKLAQIKHYISIPLGSDSVLSYRGRARDGQRYGPDLAVRGSGGKFKIRPGMGIQFSARLLPIPGSEYPISKL